MQTKTSEHLQGTGYVHNLINYRAGMLYFKIILCLLLCGTLSAKRRHGGHGIHVRPRGCRGVNYPGFGCFSNHAPFNNTRWLPQRPGFISTTFYLYTQNDPARHQILTADNEESIRNSSFDPNLPVKILVHGFLQHGRQEFLMNMMRSLLDYAPMNVIVAGWGGGAGFPYTQAVANTRVVGAEIAKLIKALNDVTSGINLENVHIIGHSLGAHVAGYAGARTPGLGRISALDPAQPNYEGFPTEVILDKSDALFVDVIHTDAQPYDTVRGYGMINPVGHVDFYPNGGHHQPGCHEETSVYDFFQDAFYNGVTDAESSLSCSHERSTQLFIDSITSRTDPCEFKAFPCQSEEDFMNGQCLFCGTTPCPIMGFHADKSFGSRGRFHLNTTNTDPFCGYHMFVTVKLAPVMAEAEGTINVKLIGDKGQSTTLAIASGTMPAGSVYTGLILGSTSLGHVTSVKVDFQQRPSYWSWSSHEVTLETIKVDSIMRMPPKYFCQHEMTLTNGQHMTLTNGTYLQSHCP